MEIWKDIKGYENYYAVSNLGRVKSLSRVVERSGNKGPYSVKERILKPSKPKNHKIAYYSVCLKKDKKTKTITVHILVASAFLFKETDELCVNHKDGNKLNNHISNLEWVTQSKNQIHAYKLGLKTPCSGENHPSSKLKKHEIKQIKDCLKYGFSQRRTASMYNVSKSLINNINVGKAWKC